MRHLPYAEFCSAILLSFILPKKTSKIVKIFIPIFIMLSVYLAISNAIYYPSYDKIKDNLGEVNGKVLALNFNSYLLIKDLPAYAAANQVFNYYYFSYDGIVDSKLEEYEHALQDGYFDYATIPSYSSDKFQRYKEIENLVRKYYCPVLESRRKGGIDIYKRCG